MGLLGVVIENILSICSLPEGPKSLKRSKTQTSTASSRWMNQGLAGSKISLTLAYLHVPIAVYWSIGTLTISKPRKSQPIRL